MYFTSGQNRAFERLMQEKPGFDHYDGGGADAGGLRHLPLLSPGLEISILRLCRVSLSAGQAHRSCSGAKFTVKGADFDMAVFRVEKNRG